MNLFRVLRLPDLFTLLNAIFGFLAIMAAARSGCGNLGHISVLLILLAAVADGMDGFLARRLGSSPLGASLDSLADLVSFGIAPAFIAAQSLDLTPSACASGTFYLLCGTLRLARFNVSEKNDKSFEGLPIPVAALALSTCVLFNNSTLTILIMLFLGLLMVSRFTYPKIKDRRILSIVSLIVLVAGFLLLWQNNTLYPALILTAIIILYLCSPVVISRLQKRK
jgi:archaetidylserine synthase